MLIQCKISGLQFYSSTLFKQDTSKKPVLSLHPIFQLSRRQLLAKARNYGAGNYSKSEEKLLFLALLNSTDHIIWESSFCWPKTQVIYRNIESLFKLVSWYDLVSPSDTGNFLKLPSIRITDENSDLNSINNFISSWYSARQEWMDGSGKKYLHEQLEAREFVLHKLIHSPLKKTENYAGRLASWAMDAAGIKDLDLREEYTSLFKLKGDEIFNASLDELIGLQNTMQKELYAPNSYGSGSGSIFSAKVLEHIGKLVAIKQGGRLFALSGGNPAASFKIKDLSLLSETSSPEEEEQLILHQLQEAGCPEEEPTYLSYGPTRLRECVLARAKWMSCFSLREDLEKVREKMKEKSKDVSI